MADEIRFEAWTLPETGTFVRQLVIGPVESFQLQVRNSQLGSGSINLPDDFPAKDQILFIDPADHSNDVGSLIRAFRDDQVLAEWYAERMSDTFSDEDPMLQVSGDSIERILGKMVVLPYDYGADPLVDPDWIYGASSVLDNTGFEQGGSKHEIQTVWNNATGGTFRLTLDAGANYTGNIAYNAAPGTVETEIETLPQVTACKVIGTGDSWNPWTVEFVDPTDPAATFTADDALLTGGTGTSTIDLVTAGGAGEFGKWTKSLNPVTGEQHGVYDTFEVSTDQARTGTRSLKIDGAAPTAYQQWPGAQQILKVVPGRQWQPPSAWVWTTSSTDLFTLIIRDVEENFIAGGVSSTATASTWTEFTVPTFVIPDGVTELIFRFAYTGSANPAIFYLDDMHFAPGLVAATFGAIFNDLLDDLNTHLTVGSWLTRTFTDALDSDGNAWDQDLSWAIKRGQSLLQLLEYAKRWGYEYRIRWTGTVHALDLFNPDGMGSDYTTADTPAIIGRISGSGPLVRRVPDFTWMLAEGDAGAYGVAEDTVLTGAFSKWMSYWANKTARTSAGLATAAAQRISDVADQTTGFLVRVQDPATGNLPLEDIVVGDILQVSLPEKQTKGPFRVAALTITGDPESSPVYEWHLSSQVFTPQAAVAEGVNRLLRTFQGLDNQAPGTGEEAVAPFTYPTSETSHAFTIRVAAYNATDASKAAADYICDGTADQVEINQAIQELNGSPDGGRVLLSEGWFLIDVAEGAGIDCTLVEYLTLEGMGRSTKLFMVNYDETENGFVIRPWGAMRIANMQIEDASWGGTYLQAAIGTDHSTMSYVTIENVYFDSNQYGIYCTSNFNYSRISGCYFFNNWAMDVEIGGGTGAMVIGNTHEFGENCYNFSWSFTSSIVANNLMVNSPTTGASFRFSGDSNQLAIVGNNILVPNNAAGIGIEIVNLTTSRPNDILIAGNKISMGGTAASTAILLDGADNISVLDNYIGSYSAPGNNFNGIIVDDTPDAHISGNTIHNYGGTGILLRNGSDRASVTNNRLVGDSPTNSINVSTSDCDAVVIFGNDIENGGAIADSGTGTLIGPAANEWDQGLTRSDGHVVYWDNASATYKLKSVTPGGAGSDTTAIHDNVIGEISAVTSKGTPVSGDFLLIEDSAASDAKKSITIGTLPDDGIVTTKGDLYGFSTVPARIPVGTNGDVLTAASADAEGIVWQTPGKVGSDTIADTNASVTVTHGLGATPSSVLVTPQADDRIWVTTVGATTFQVNRAGTSGTLDFFWRADL